MILLQIDTSIINKFDHILTAIIIVTMVITVIFNIKNLKNSILSLTTCGVLLFVVNDPNQFIKLLGSIFSFVGGTLNA